MNVTNSWPPPKPLWVQVCGWISLGCISIVIGIPLVEVLTHYHIPRTVWPGLLLLASFPMITLWCFGTIVHRAHVASMVNMATALKRSAATSDIAAQHKLGG
jgi:drug/metabolite transporter (DMT)-like permease